MPQSANRLVRTAPLIMTSSDPGSLGLDDVLINQELSLRESRSPDLLAENQALHTLARQLVNQPQIMLKSLVTMALNLCHAGTAGVSLLEVTQSGEEVFRWVALAGALEAYEQSTTPANFSPCSICLERRTPQLYSYPERYFTYLKQTQPTIVESLVLPLQANNRPLGTIWILSHNEERQFDGEDVRVMTSLADFTAAALTSSNARQAAEESARREQIACTEAEVARERVTNILESITDAFYTLDCNWRFTHVNCETERLLGRESEDLLGKNIWEEYPHAVDTSLYQAYHQALNERVTVSIEFYYPPFDCWYDVSAYPCEQGLSVYFRDITDRKRMEEALRQSEERYRCLVTATSSIVGTVAGNGAIKEDVPSWQEFTGQTPEQYKNFGWLNAVHPDDRQPVAEIWQRAWGNKEPFEAEYRLLHYDAEYRHVVSRSVPILDASGNVREWVGTVTDIHEQRQAEEKLRETEAKLMGLFRSDVVGIMWGEEELILECNDEMLRMLGYTRDELLDGGLNWNEMTPKEEKEQSAQAVQEAIETGKFAPFEKNFIRKDGSRVPTILGGSCLGTTPFRYVSFVLDISDRKRAEEQIKVSLREKEVLLKEIHHRVKNNLQVIYSLLRLQSEYIEDEQALKSFEASQLRVKSMALIHEKLYKSYNVSSIDAAEYIRSLAMEVFRSYNVTKQTISLKINAENVTLSPDTAIPCSLILCELIANALKHAFPNQDNAQIDIQLSSHGDMFSLLVRDNGVGMPEDLDFRNTESLGLQLVMDLVEQLEGTIEVQRLGGTTFKITFMASAQEAK